MLVTVSTVAVYGGAPSLTGKLWAGPIPVWGVTMIHPELAVNLGKRKTLNLWDIPLTVTLPSLDFLLYQHFISQYIYFNAGH